MNAVPAAPRLGFWRLLPLPVIVRSSANAEALIVRMIAPVAATSRRAVRFSRRVWLARTITAPFQIVDNASGSPAGVYAVGCPRSLVRPRRRTHLLGFVRFVGD